MNSDSSKIDIGAGSSQKMVKIDKNKHVPKDFYIKSHFKIFIKHYNKSK